MYFFESIGVSCSFASVINDPVLSNMHLFVYLFWSIYWSYCVGSA